MLRDIQKFVRDYPMYGVLALIVLVIVCISMYVPAWKAWYTSSVINMLAWYLLMIGGTLFVLMMGMTIEYVLMPRIRGR